MRWLDGQAEPENEVEQIAYDAGVSAVLRIRCLQHRDVPQYNAAESAGGECAACEVERLRAEMCERSEGLTSALAALDAAQARIAELEGKLGWECVRRAGY